MSDQSVFWGLKVLFFFFRFTDVLVRSYVAFAVMQVATSILYIDLEKLIRYVKTDTGLKSFLTLVFHQCGRNTCWTSGISSRVCFSELLCELAEE